MKALRSDAVSIIEPDHPRVPLVFSSAHSGRDFPEGFAPAVALTDLIGFEDRFVDDLIADAPRYGVVNILANFPRAYIDPNRAPDDLDDQVIEESWTGTRRPTLQSARGIGLIFRQLQDGKAIYDRPLTHAELDHRLQRYWQPFHDQLDAVLDATHIARGGVWHVDWHSMRPVGDALAPDPGAIRPDFVVSDLDGASSGQDFRVHVAGVLERLGYSVAINDPFRGGYIISRAGAPGTNRHSLQVEINRKLYLDPDTLARSRGFAPLRQDLAAVAQELATFANDAGS